ncbi:ABC transporter ATP-binding protein [Isoptericola sediminis]|nr:ABC transporter ATP-binding protein [Isoptericola sediminis]
MYGARDLTVELGGATALSDVSVAVPSGEVTAVVGGDGAGKTTLLRALLGRVAAVRGTVDVPPAPRIGHEPFTSGVWPTLTVRENVEFVGSAYGMSAAGIRTRAADLLATAGLDDVRDRLGRDLSGGMRQKLGFCLAMLHTPDLLLLDEPSTGVDPVSRVELWRLITQAARSGAAVLMTTTYLDEAERAATVVALQDGQVLATGRPTDVVGTVPGTVSVGDDPPGGHDRTWRRGRSFHTWTPDGATAPGRPVTPDLEDTLIALTLARQEETR